MRRFGRLTARVQARCGAQRSNVACNPLLCRLSLSKLTHFLCLWLVANLCILFNSRDKWLYRVIELNSEFFVVEIEFFDCVGMPTEILYDKFNKHIVIGNKAVLQKLVFAC